MGTEIARIDPQALIAQAVEKGAGIETLERLLALAKEVRAEQAKEAYHDAITKFKAACPDIIKSKKATIQSRRTGGSFGYTYAPLDKITATIDPVLGPLGLSYRWRHRSEGLEVRVACVVSHRLGHSEDSGEMAVPISTDETGASAMQKLGIAVTYGKRYTLLGALGLSPEDDPDGAGEDKKSDGNPPPKTYVHPPAQPTQPKTIDVQASTQASHEGFGFVSDNLWRGVIEDVNVSEGTSAKGPWKRFDIIGTGNQKFQTFSESFGKLAADFMASGGICEIFYQKKVNGKYTNYEVTNIQAFAGDEPPNPAEAEDIPV